MRWYDDSFNRGTFIVRCVNESDLTNEQFSPSRDEQKGDGMNETGLKVWYIPENECHGELHAEVHSNAFTGKSSAWFELAEIREKFISALRIFPITETAAPMIEGGFRGKEGTIEQCHLRIRIKPYNRRGTLLVQTDLATDAHQSPDVDMQQSITARFSTEYTELEKFAAEFEQHLDGAREFGMLRGLEN